MKRTDFNYRIENDGFIILYMGCEVLTVPMDNAKPFKNPRLVKTEKAKAAEDWIQSFLNEPGKRDLKINQKIAEIENSI